MTRRLLTAVCIALLAYGFAWGLIFAIYSPAAFALWPMGLGISAAPIAGCIALALTRLTLTKEAKIGAAAVLVATGILGVPISGLFVENVGCFGCGAQAAVYVNGATCYAASRSCQIVLFNDGASDRQVVGCFWADPNTGGVLSNGTLYVNDSARPQYPSVTQPYTVPARATVTAYCLDFAGTPTIGSWVVPGVREAGGYLTSYWGSSTGNPMWM